MLAEAGAGVHVGPAWGSPGPGRAELGDGGKSLPATGSWKGPWTAWQS